MKCLTHRIPYHSTNDVIRIKPIFDVHYGASACDVAAFRKYISDPDAYYFIGGDLLNCIVVKDKGRYTKHEDATRGDEVVDEQIDGMVELLTPIKDRIIGIGSGNHEDAILKYHSTNPTKRLCRRLGCPNLGVSGLIKLVFRREAGGGRKVVIRYHHGWGGGSRTQGADLTKYSKDMNYWDADIFLYGHVHRLQSDTVPRMGIWGEDSVISKPRLLGICGTFLKTYTNSEYATYSEIKGYPPVIVGGLTVNIKPHREGIKYWIDM